MENTTEAPTQDTLTAEDIAELHAWLDELGYDWIQVCENDPTLLEN